MNTSNRTELSSMPCNDGAAAPDDAAAPDVCCVVCCCCLLWCDVS